jgi:hypothetical protein
MSREKALSILTMWLSPYECVDIVGSSGDILTVWDPSVFTLTFAHCT